MDVINVETNQIRRSVHTPDYPFPWVDLRKVDLSEVQVASPHLWVIEPVAKGAYRARMKTVDELSDPVTEAEEQLRKLREETAQEIREATENGIDPDLVELAAIGGFSLTRAVASPEAALILAGYKDRKKEALEAAESIDGNLKLG